MKKAIALISLVALFGCTEEEIKDTLSGKTKVFAVESVEVAGLSGLADGTHSVTDSKLASLLPDVFPNGTKADLDNYGIGTHGSSCAKIDTTTPVCFEDGKSCTPSEMKQLNLKVYKIDLTDIKSAYENAKFFPTLATQLGIEGLSQIDIQEVNCP
ncbi:hypothetical protein L4D00_17995 [Photobacterium swingsii]|uniref:Uncharacterized protein n=1 Tax=Photobacterium swingsii TaxID=680026 RepID=A0A0J8VD48_9GAMM|nr:hypothetical protein [Photobacterium swingsii]KMV31413.1 hypothetical protein AB733_04565 [Photobacterium swingsii]PSW25080.1 hypothetical protein C9I94_09770 [Photobacterium swingsii]